MTVIAMVRPSPDRAQLNLDVLHQSSLRASSQVGSSVLATGPITPRWTPTPTRVPGGPHAPALTPTPTPTSMPGPPELLQPADGAVLPQPVFPQQWLFTWTARMGPCWGSISITGPNGQHVTAQVPYPYQYTYSATDFLPANALGPWQWFVGVYCPLGSNYSETRTFWVESAHWRFLPIVRNNH